MSVALRRLVVVASAAGTAAVLTALPAGAAASAAVTSTPHTGGKAASTAGRAATVDGDQLDAAGAAAGRIGVAISGATCFSNDIVFTADTYETGFSGVQRFRQRAQVQEFTTVGWVARSPVSVATSTRFPNDGRSFHFTRDWDDNHVADGASWRVVWQGLYLSGGGAVVGSTKLININCL